MAGTFLIFTDFSPVFADPDYKINFIYVFLLAFLSSATAVLLMNILIKHTTALFVSTVTYIIPIFAIMWGLIDGEMFTFIDVIWIIIVLAGVYMVNRKQKLRKT